MDQFIDLEKLGNTLILINAVESNDIKAAQYALNEGVDPNEKLPKDLFDFIIEDEEDGFRFRTPISNVKSLEMAKLLCTNKIDFKNIEDIDMIGGNKEITEYYLSVGLDPKLLNYLWCYDEGQFIELGVIDYIHHVRPEVSKLHIDKVVELIKNGARFDESHLLRHDIKIVKAQLEEDMFIDHVKYENGKYFVKFKDNKNFMIFRDLDKEVKEFLNEIIADQEHPFHEFNKHVYSKNPVIKMPHPDEFED